MGECHILQYVLCPVEAKCQMITQVDNSHIFAAYQLALFIIPNKAKI